MQALPGVLQNQVLILPTMVKHLDGERAIRGAKLLPKLVLMAMPLVPGAKLLYLVEILQALLNILGTSGTKESRYLLIIRQETGVMEHLERTNTVHGAEIKMQNLGGGKRLKVLILMMIRLQRNPQVTGPILKQKIR